MALSISLEIRAVSLKISQQVSLRTFYRYSRMLLHKYCCHLVVLSHVTQIFMGFLLKKRRVSNLFTSLTRGELSYLAPLGSENMSAPYFKQCFFQGGGITPQTVKHHASQSQDRNNKYFILYMEFCINNKI